MATTIGTEAYKLIADTRGFVSGIENAKAALQGFNPATSISRLGTVAARFGGVAAAAGAAASALSSYQQISDQFTNSAISSLTALTEVADKVGDSSREFLLLVKESQQFGLDSGTLATLTQKLAKSLVEGKAADAMKTLRLDMQAISNMKPGAALAAVVDALGKVENLGQRTSLAATLFGKGGLALAELLGASDQERAIARRAAGQSIGASLRPEVLSAALQVADRAGQLRAANATAAESGGFSNPDQAARVALARAIIESDSMADMTSGNALRYMRGWWRQAELPFMRMAGVGKYRAEAIAGYDNPGSSMVPWRRSLIERVNAEEARILAEGQEKRRLEVAEFNAKQEAARTQAAASTEQAKAAQAARAAANGQRVGEISAALANLIGQTLGFGAAFGGASMKGLIAKAAKDSGGFSNLASAIGGADAFGAGQRASESNRRANEMKAAAEKTARAAEEQVRQQQQTNRNLEDATAAIRSLGTLVGLVR